MQTATSYLDGVLSAIDVVADRFAAQVTAAPDPAVQVPSSPGWTVRDVAAHLATVAVRYADGPEGRRGVWTETPLGLPTLNHDQIEALGTATVGDLVASLRRELAGLQAQIRGYGSRPPSFHFHGGEHCRAGSGPSASGASPQASRSACAARPATCGSSATAACTSTQPDAAGSTPISPPTRPRSCCSATGASRNGNTSPPAG
jgi:hypothetical protein